MFAEACTKDIADIMMPSLYAPKQSHSLYIRYMSVCRQMMKNAKVLPMMESRNDTLLNGKDLGITRFYSKLLYVSPASFIIQPNKASSFYIDNPTKSTNFHHPGSYPFGQQCYESCPNCMKSSGICKIPFYGSRMQNGQRF